MFLRLLSGRRKNFFSFQKKLKTFCRIFAIIDLNKYSEELLMQKKILRYIALMLVVSLLCVCLVGCGVEASPETEPTQLRQQITQTLEKDMRTWAEQMIAAYADYRGISASSYPLQLVELLDKNHETASFVLEYPFEHDKEHVIDLSEYVGSETMPLFLQWDKRWGYLTYGADMAGITACGPLCLSMVAFYLTGDVNMSPDKIMAYSMENKYCVPGKGTAWTLISRGAEGLGLNAKELPLVESRVRRELEAGNPVICVMGPGVFTTTGHFIVLTGYEDGKYRVNDPNSVERSNKLWSFSEFSDQIRNLWAMSLKEEMKTESGEASS